MKVAVLQLPIDQGNVEANVQNMERMLAEAMEAEPRPDVVLLPELWNTGFYPQPIKSFADEEGYWQQRLGELASQYTVNIVGGSVPVLHSGRVYNESYSFNRGGKLLGTYQKLHLFSPAGEHKDFTPGEELITFKLDGIKCGVVICYDIRFPEIVRKLALAEIDILFVSAAWPLERILHWDTLLRARAIENQFFVVAANGIAPVHGDDMHLGGHSAIYDPWGGLLAQGSDDNLNGEILQANLQVPIIQEIRSTINVFKDRRPELY